MKILVSGNENLILDSNTNLKYYSNGDCSCDYDDCSCDCDNCGCDWKEGCNGDGYVPNDD